MRAHVLSGSGINGLAIRELPEPTPGPGEVVVLVGATSLNFRDLLIARGATDRIPLSDGAGVVSAVGEGVRGVSVGDHVAGCFFQHWLDGRIEARHHDAALGGSVDGMLAEAVVLPAAGVVAAPRGWSDEQSATLPCAGLTAWNALVEGQRLRPGATVLLLGTGGVSVFGLQFAQMLGLRTIMTSSSDDKLARMRDLGADVTINYRTHEEWQHLVLEATGGAGVDLVLEVGGGQTLARSMACTRFGGEIALIGMVSGQAPIDPFPLLGRSATLRGVYVGSRRMFTDMVAAIDANPMEPVIDRVFAFDEAQDAYRHLRGQSHVGKVVIAVGSQSLPA
ncbi:MAG: NAD(P)-dependent alcohol dehydrogenase [Candidatus Nanopelagicales bacterium]|nr:NAD(P)-dependent alcohol dehydrogenase [Candidatus Nanopelagicales bacterium]